MAAKKSTLRLLGEEIRLRRKSLGLNQEELAEGAGLHRTFISSVERGKKNISILSLEALATSLDVSMTDLIAAVERGKR